jgi:hypothetical protein
MNCTIYTMSYNFVTHAICPLTFMAYKYNDLQVSSVTQKLSCKASCKPPLFLMVIIKVEHFAIVSRMLSWKLDLGNIWIKENLENINFVMKVD